jgi:adenylosuccinate lyase
MFAEYGQVLSLVAKTWGKIAQEVFLLQGDDFRELEEASLGVGSSTMPHKVNPAHSRTVVQLSRQIPRQAEVMLDWMVSIHERDQISNADMIGEISVTADRLARAAVQMTASLKVNEANMRRNLGRTNGLIMAEHAMFLVGQKIGKHTAHEEVGAAAKAAWAKGTTLPDELAARPGLAKIVAGIDLKKELDPAAYLGLAPESVDRTVAAIRRARAADADPPAYPEMPR